METESVAVGETGGAEAGQKREKASWAWKVPVAVVALLAAGVVGWSIGRSGRSSGGTESSLPSVASEGQKRHKYSWLLNGVTTFTVGVDMESLRESIMAQAWDTNNTAAINARIDEALKDIYESVAGALIRRLENVGVKDFLLQSRKGLRFYVKIPASGEKACDETRRALQTSSFLEFRLTHPRNQKLAADLLASGKVPEGYAASAKGDGFVRVENYNAIVTNTGYKARLAAFGTPPQGYQFMLEKNKEGVYVPHYVSRRIELTGRDIVSAEVDRDELGRPVVAFRLSGKGGIIMRKLTRNYIVHGERNPTDRGRELAVVLDGELLSAPVLQSEISTRGQISGDFTREEAQRLANDLNAGALPVPLKVLEEVTEGALPDEE